MQIEVMSEDRSAVPVLEKFMGDVLKKRQETHEINFRPHRGLGTLPHNLRTSPVPNKTGLLDLLPAKLRAYERLSDSSKMMMIVVHDSDDNDPNDCYRQLEFLLRTFSPSYLFVIGISVEEMEAWLMGDFEAIKAAYPDADYRVWKRYNQDSVCGTWEILARVIEGNKKSKELIRVGYPAVGIYKNEWASAIAPYLDASRNASPSLADFLKRFDHVLDMAKEDASKDMDKEMVAE